MYLKLTFHIVKKNLIKIMKLLFQIYIIAVILSKNTKQNNGSFFDETAIERYKKTGSPL